MARPIGQSTISRRTILKGGAAAAGAAALAAGGGGRIRGAGAQDKVKLTWWDYYDGANGTSVDAQLKRYTDANPNVQIERTYIPFADLKQKLLQGATAGSLPDIVIIDNPDHQAFAALGVLADITDRVKEWGEEGSY